MTNYLAEHFWVLIAGMVPVVWGTMYLLKKPIDSLISIITQF